MCDGVCVRVYACVTEGVGGWVYVNLPDTAINYACTAVVRWTTILDNT